jgi:uncharacterized membrane protein
MAPNKPDIPEHVNDTIIAMSHLHAEHDRRTHRVLRVITAAFAAIGSPAMLLVLTLLVLGWVGFNLMLLAQGRRPPDPPPFAYLDGAASLAALYLAAFIVITQKHDDELTTRRDQLTLQLALLNDQKAAKIIRLLEELRYNDPHQGNHPDAEAEAMAKPADPRAVLAKISASQTALRDDA